ncbi:hypothetical protein [Alloactinosynnema sp. L-07]|uniref:hypothetical protein n=1 Tax=Alloactinosynnema sp. L-07 TaxID=1653480 RepID=UPI00065F0AB4|nr:hypothetical protein [Alloactinosynnema sp. L-07]CRK57666.1 hypothetical protein [Alloactinosynnema sp. L-07]
MNHHHAEPVWRLSWGSSPFYRGRAHLVAPGWPRALCGTVAEATDGKPAPLVCPECAIVFADTAIARMLADRGGWERW